MVEALIARKAVRRVDFTGSIRVGRIVDPRRSPACAVGPMISAVSGQRTNELLNDVLAKGAILARGGAASGAVIRAVISDHVRPGQDSCNEEVFGPVVSLGRMRDSDEALRMSNDTDYSPSSRVLGHAITRALSGVVRLQCGTAHINRSTVRNETQASYGGVEDSGSSRFDGRAVMDTPTELTCFATERAAREYPV